MKKAFPFKKRLSAALAVVLAVAGAAGATPASAQDETYAYSVIGDYGNFESTLWHFSDNSSEDTLSFNAEKQPVVTKGTKSTGSEATALSYRRVTLAAGDYQLSFSLKASSQAYYIVSGYGFDSAGNAEALKYEKTAEGSVGTEWTDVTANFTVNGSYPSVEFRIILRGAAGTQITVDKLETKAFEEKPLYAYEPSLDGWTDTQYKNCGEVYSYVELSTDGYSNPGSVHFYRDYSQNLGGDASSIGYMLKSMAANKTYVFEFYLKGNANNAGDPLTVNLNDNSAAWAASGTSELKLTKVNAADWTKYSYEFTTTTARWLPLRIGVGGYAGADCYLDDIKIYEKDGDGTNLLSNSTFAVPATTLENWTDTQYNNRGETYSYVELSTDGYSNPGSVHFYRDYSQSLGGNASSIGYMLKSMVANKTYVFEFYLKGNANNAGDPLTVNLNDSSAAWAASGTSELKLIGVNAADWTKYSYEFTTTTVRWLPLRIGVGGYAGADCYLDNIKIYEKDGDGTNLLPNSTFAVPATTLENWTDTQYNNRGEVYSYVELSTDGYLNPGSVHFYRDYSQSLGGNASSIGYMLKSMVANKTYVFEFYLKGNANNAGDPLTVNLNDSSAAWAASGTSELKLIGVNAADWTKYSYEFTTTTAHWLPLRIGVGGYAGADCYLDNIKIYEKDGDGTNLLPNSDFCKTEKVLINENLIKNDEVKLTDIPGIDMGMLRKEGASAAAVPGGSYDGSTALKVTADGLEGYFQTYGNESETDFPDAVKRGKIAFVKGDTAIKASGYFKKLDTSDADAEPKVWFGFGKEYTVKKFLVSKTISSIGSHYNSESDRLDTEKYEDIGNGWVKFEMSLTDDMLASSELKTSLAEAERIRFMCGVDGYDSENKKKYFGEALFDDVKFEIISKYAPGDSNGDGAIDIRDLIHMKKYAAGTVKFTDMTRGTWLSDIGYNESPSITNEMVCMRKYLIGTSSEYGK